MSVIDMQGAVHSGGDVLVPLMADIFNLINEMDLGALSPSAVHIRFRACSDRIRQIVPDLAREEFYHAIRAPLERMDLALQEKQRALNERATPAQIKAVAKSLGEDYERIVAAARSHPSLLLAGLDMKTLRPRNYARNVFHIGSAIGCVLLYEFLLTWGQCMFCLSFVLVLYGIVDILRRFKPEWQEALFDKALHIITRPRERYTVPAATWYVLGMILALAFADKIVTQVAVLVLGVGDPAATLVGRRWGRIKVWKEKSLEGSCGFAAAAFVISLAWLLLRSTFTNYVCIEISLIAAVVGALSELFSNDIFDDNLVVPVTVSFVLKYALPYL